MLTSLYTCTMSDRQTSWETLEGGDCKKMSYTGKRVTSVILACDARRNVDEAI